MLIRLRIFVLMIVLMGILKADQLVHIFLFVIQHVQLVQRIMMHQNARHVHQD